MFLDKDFLLNTEAARVLYHEAAEACPIIDYHCHINGSQTSDHDKFIKWAEVLGKGIGNPLYHWSHLELRRFFGYEGN